MPDRNQNQGNQGDKGRQGQQQPTPERGGQQGGQQGGQRQGDMDRGKQGGSGRTL